MLLKSKNLLYVPNFFILSELLSSGFPHIEQFTSQWEHTTVISTHSNKPGQLY